MLTEHATARKPNVRKNTASAIILACLVLRRAIVLIVAIKALPKEIPKKNLLILVQTTNQITVGQVN